MKRGEQVGGFARSALRSVPAASPAHERLGSEILEQQQAGLEIGGVDLRRREAERAQRVAIATKGRTSSARWAIAL